MLAPEAPYFNLAEAIELRGALRIESFREAVRLTLREMQALHLRIIVKQGEPAQVAHEPGDVPLEWIDLSNEADAVQRAREWMRAAAACGFDLFNGPLCEAALLRLAPQHHIYYFCAHHLVADGSSGRIIAARLAARYSTLLESRPDALPAMPPWHGLLKEELHYRGGARYLRDREFWSRAMAAGSPPATVSGRAPQALGACIQSRVMLPEPVVTALRAVAARAGCTLPQCIAAAAAIYLHRCSGTREPTLGIPVTARAGTGLHGTFGMCSNALPLRLAMQPGDGIGTVLAKVARGLRELMRHQRYPILDLRRDLGLRPEDPQPWGLVVNVLSFDYDLHFAGLATRVDNAGHWPVADLAITVYDRHDGRDMQIEFNAHPANYEADGLQAHVRRWVALLDQLIQADATLPIGRLDLLLPQEREGLSRQLATQPLPATTLAGLLREQAARTPQAVALICGAEVLDYAELHRRANRLARSMLARGVEPEDRVAVMLPRSPALVVALLATLQAGAAYLPIDPAYPAARRRQMLDIGRPKLVIDAGFVASGDAAPLPRLHPEHPACVIFTSGSTGVPKAVVISHRAMVNHMAWMAAAHPLAADDRVLARTSVSFDAAGWELWLPLVSGAAFVLADDEEVRDADRLLALMARQRVSVAQFAPGLLATVLDASHEAPPALRAVFAGGEALGAALAGRLQREWQVPLTNLYGPTETTIDASAWTGAAPAAGTVPIGDAIWNTTLHVLDAALQPVPPGCEGELYIGGLGLARGYFGRPAATAERFVADPYGPPGARLYRSGDRVRHGGNGTLEFIGRADAQIKLRGVRIELGEIEAALLALPGMRQCAVVVHGDGAARRLVAYVVADNTDDWPSLLAESLPPALLPSSFITLPSLPLTPNGKLDRAALPAPESTRPRVATEPATDTERRIAALWAEVLGGGPVGVDDDFFALGGNSLTAMQVVSRLRRRFDIELPMRSLFDAPRLGELARAVDAAGAAARAEPMAIGPQPRPARPPLSYAQTRLWLLHRLEGPSATYNLPLALRLEGELDVAALHAALGDLVARHESLRTLLAEHDGAPWQRVLPIEGAKPALPVLAIDESMFDAALETAAHEVFELDREMPLRATLWRFGPRSHGLLVLLHHVAADGWSAGPLARELAEAYAARRSATAPAWRALPLQYIDHAIWQRNRLGHEDDPASPMARQLAFWRSALDGAPEELALPTDFARPPQPSYRGASLSLALDAEWHVRALALAHGSSASLFMLLHAALAGLLSRLGAGSDIVIGTPVAGRNEPALEGLIGFFVNTLVLRCDTAGRPSLRELLARARRFDLAAYAHQELPFERLVDALAPSRVPGRNPLFQVLLALQSRPAASPALADLEVTPQPLQSAVAKFDLGFDLVEHHRDGRPAGLTGTLDYSIDRFSAATAQALAERWQAWLRAACDQPDRPLAELPLLNSTDIEQLKACNDTAHPLPAGTLIELFDAQAARTPDATAVVFEGRSLGYAELKRRANRLAHGLIDRGIGPEDLVGIALERSLELPIAVLGVLKAGGAYLPLDPKAPPARRAQMLDEARPRCVLDEQTTWPDGGADHDIGDDQRRRPLHPQHPAYVLYTSGSTGRPKGAPNTHAGLLNRLAWMQHAYPIGPPDAVLQKTPIGFDVSVWELLWPLLHGARLVLAAPEAHRDPHALATTIVQERITLLHFVPSMLQAFLDEPAARVCDSLRTIVCSGEALPAATVHLARQVLPQAALHNLYGPTEAAIDVSAWACGADDEQRAPPIGLPVWNTRLLVLDRALEPCPPGIAGELYIGGIELARGYLQRPALTAERFVADPYGPPGARLYRSGDLARRRADGALDYLGRADQQIKLHGQRIEPGEIEAVLLQQPRVSQAAVVARNDGPAGLRLIAYIVGEADGESLRSALAERLPAPMLPSAFVHLAALPLSPNGKLDRAALPAPRHDGNHAPVAASTPLQALLCRLYAELLALPQAGIDDSFFALGGDSIQAILLVSRLRREGWLLKPGDVFRCPKVRELAACVTALPEHEAADDRIARDGPLLPTPIMRAHMQAGGALDQFSQTVWLHPPAALSVERLQAALQALVDTHDALRLRASQDGCRWHCEIAPPGSSQAAGGIAIVPAAEVAFTPPRLDLAAGRPWQVQWITGASPRLRFTVHHFAVDAVSWRVLLPDLAAAWQAVSRSETPALPPVPTPYRQWNQRLAHEAASAAVLAERPRWQALVAAGEPLMPDAGAWQADTYASARRIDLALTAAETQALLVDLPKAFHAHPNDVLLTALAMATSTWRRQRGESEAPFTVDVEGHGRKPLSTGDLDLSRTVGWFTSVWPVRLDAASATAEAALKRVKEQLRAVPGRGLGHGLLRWLHDPADTRLHSRAQIGFNYLGRIARPSEPPLPWAAAVPLHEHEPEVPLPHPIEIECQAEESADGLRLQARWRWARSALGQHDGEALAMLWAAALRSLASLTREGRRGHTPSDFPLLALSQADVDTIDAALPAFDELLPLAPLQQGLYFHALYEPGRGDAYTVQVALALEGRLDARHLRSAAQALLQRHANLRAGFRHDGLRQPLQWIARQAALPWHDEDLAEADVDAWLAAERSRPFDPGTPPLLRFALLRTAPQRHRLVLTYHHLLMDGWSLPVLFDKLFALYRGVALPEAPPYREHLAWLARQDLALARDLWRQHLAGLEPLRVALAPLQADATHESWFGALSPERTVALQARLRSHALTLATLMQGLWALLLGRLTGREDVVFGLTVAGRPAELPQVESRIGLFINTLPWRIRWEPRQPLWAWLADLQQQPRADLEQTPLGLAEIQQLAGAGELFDALMVIENYPLDADRFSALHGLRIAGVDATDGTHYPLGLLVSPGPQLRLRLDHDPRRFAPGLPAQLGATLLQWLEAAIDGNERPLHRLPMPAAPLPSIAPRQVEPMRLEALFETSARQRPEAPALLFGGERLSYAQLNRRANRLAHALMARGIGAEDFVGIALPRSPALIAAVLATLKAGAACLPLESELPPARLAQLLDEARPKIVLDIAQMQALEEAAAPTPLPEHDPAPSSARRIDHPAYLAYTSGSTGRPKGVVVTHGGLAAFARTHVERAAIEPDSRVVQLASLGFDVAFGELAMSWAAGAALVLIQHDERAGPALQAVLRSQRVTHLMPTPSALATLPDPTGLPELESIVFGGEPCPDEVLQRWSPGRRICSGYGLTETSIGGLLGPAAARGDLGSTIHDMRAYVLDAWLEPLPAGATGELYLAGPGLARGYRADAPATAARFVADPFGPPGSRMYRSGDLVHRRADGSFCFAGRRDGQVKVRSQRIELGEIEAALCRLPEVAQAAVLAFGDGRLETRLVAYVVAQAVSPIDATRLRDALRASLPEAMLPSAIVPIEALPLNANGKLDRRALPAPEFRQAPYRAPRDADEALLCELFAEILALPQAGIDDHFFELGGHSLSATQLISRIRPMFEVELQIRALYEHPTVAALSLELARLRADADVEELTL